MVRYEIKKVLDRPSGRIALFLLAMIIVYCCWLCTTGVEWINEQGDTETGHAAVKKLRDAQNQWEGVLDEAKITAAINDLHRIAATPEAKSKDYTQNDIAYGWKQAIKPIREWMYYAYAVDKFPSFDWYVPESVPASAAPQFYSNRVEVLKEYLYDRERDGYNKYSEREKQYLISQYEELETPVYYDYKEGWSELLHNISGIMLLDCLVLGFLVSGIFANEFKWKSDALYFTTVYGRNKAVSAKIKAGFLLVTFCYWGSVLLYTPFPLCYLGFDGGNCPIQFDYWRSIYNLTYWQAYLLFAISGYIGNLFIAFLCMWVSAKTRSSLFAVTIPFILIFVPAYLESNTAVSDNLSKLFGLLPDKLLMNYSHLKYINVYDLGFTAAGDWPILLLLYASLILILLPLMYQEFRKKQIGE